MKENMQSSLIQYTCVFIVEKNSKLLNLPLVWDLIQIWH
jgi:hypothetical protein